MLDKTNDLPEMKYTTDFMEYQVSLMILGVAGQIYPVIRFKNLHKSKTFYSLSEYIEFCKSEKIREPKASRYLYSSFGSFFHLGSEKDIKDFFSQDTTKFQKWFHTYNTPIFTYYRNSRNQVVDVNISLKELEFYRIKDTFTAFQDVYMFLSGVLRSKENHTVTISDKDKIHKHGFNKFSFRKQKGD